MIIYFLVAIFSGSMMFLSNKILQKTGKNFFVILSFLPFFCITAFRYGIGYDYLNIYTKIFNSIINGAATNWEPAIVLICKLIGKFSSDPFYFFFITSLITCIFIYKAILKNSLIPWLSLILFIVSGLYMDSMNAVRQYIAISIFAYSFKFIEEQNLKKYIISIIVATLFHSSAIMLLPIYFFCNLKLTPKKKFWVCVFIIILLPLFNIVFMTIISHTKYAFYISSVYGKANPTYSELLVSSILFFISTILYKKNKDDNRYNIYYNLTFLFFIMGILSFKILLAYRVIMYFKISLIFMVPLILKSVKKGGNRLFVGLTLLFLLSGITLIGAYKFKWYDTKYISIFNK